MYKSGSANRFDRIWNVSTDEYTGKHVELAIKYNEFTGVKWVFINCYQYQGRTENPTGITFENANQFCRYADLMLCVYDTTALLKCMPDLFGDKSEVIVSMIGRISGRELIACVDKIYDDKSDFIIGMKTGGCWVQRVRFTPSEFKKLQSKLPEVLSYAGKPLEPMGY